MNIYQKLQKCRVDVQKSINKKSGHNTFSNYNYYELGDFLPQINEYMDKYHLTAIFSYGTEQATLTIVNTEKIDEKIEFSTPIEVAQLKGCNAMQNIGGTQTFARRYLYVMAFEISEIDIINNGEIDSEAELERKKIDLAKVETLKQLIKKTNTDEKLFLEYFKVKKIEDITNGLFVRCMSTLQKKLSEVPKEHIESREIDLGI
jgi:hypothetical protein